MRTCFRLAVLLAPAVALANGGPVDSTSPTAVGGVQPVKEPNVRLVSEDLTLSLAADGKTYQAEAFYVLSNPTAARSVTFGVPVVLASDAVEPMEDQALDPKLRRQLEAGIRIEAGGKAFPCNIVQGAGPAESAPKLDDISEGETSYPAPAFWCVTRIELPAGSAIPVTLAYTGGMEFVDWGTNKSELVGYSRRFLRYALFPAGYWAGTPDHVAIRLDTGRFQGLVTGDPAPTRQDGAALIWELAHPDLKALGWLKVTVNSELVLRHDGLVKLQAHGSQTFRQKDGEPIESSIAFRAKASSTLAAQGSASYGAENAVDGVATTAWCEGKPTEGTGEWLEVRRILPNNTLPHGSGCSFEGFVVVPGYAKSAAAYSANNRLRAFRISPCGSSQGGQEFHLEPGGDPTDAWGNRLRLSDHHDRSALFVRVGDLKDPSCARLTILEVVKGKANDTCISEFRPILNCG